MPKHIFTQEDCSKGGRNAPKEVKDDWFNEQFVLIHTGIVHDVEYVCFLYIGEQFNGEHLFMFKEGI